MNVMKVPPLHMKLRKFTRAGTYQKQASLMNMPQLSTDNEDDSSDGTPRFKNRKSLNIMPLKVDTSSKGTTNDPRKLVEKMKSKVRKIKKKGYNSTKSPNDFKLSYIFATPGQHVAKEEQKITDFLDREGIFQIHLDIVMKECDFTYACN